MSLAQQPTHLTAVAPALRQRFISAAVLIPVTYVCVWIGGLALASLAMLLGAAMLWEVARATLSRDAAASHQHVGRSLAGRAAVLSAALAYITLAGASLIGLRQQLGPWPVLWLFALVWAADTAGYAAGRRFGRRALMPGISPEKTWEGLLAAVTAGSLTGLILAPKLPALSHFSAAYLSAALAALSQMGDLLESAVKRRLGVKNMSELIPGHGGVCDRLDSLLPVLIAAAGAMWLWRAAW